MNRVEVFVDAGCTGNPGIASYAFVVFKDGDEIHRDSGVLGVATNNEAEYLGIIKVLEYLAETKPDEAVIHSDSSLAVNQIRGKYAVRDARILSLWNYVKTCLNSCARVRFVYTPRSDKRIHLVDRLCNAVRNIYKNSLKAENAC